MFVKRLEVKLISNLYNKYKEIINYIIVGILTTIVSLLTYYICVYTFLNPNKSIELQFANIISWVLAVIFAYFVNRKYVFNSKNKKKKKEFVSFSVSRILTLVLDMLFMFVSVSVFKFNDKIMKLVSNFFVMVGNYLLGKFLVFKKKDNK